MLPGPFLSVQLALKPQWADAKSRRWTLTFDGRTRPPYNLSTGQGLREKIFQGVRRSIQGVQILLGPQALSGHMLLNHFLSNGCRSLFKSAGITIYRMQLELLKNTTRHKIGLNPARGFGEAL